jgi:hypothetical protein
MLLETRALAFHFPFPRKLSLLSSLLSQEINMDIVTPAVIAGLSMLSESVIKDAYDKLKNTLASKFNQKSDLMKAIGLLEEKPESQGRREILREELHAANAHLDADVVQAAEALYEQIRLQTNVQQNVQQNVIGDHNIFSGTGNVSVHKDD